MNDENPEAATDSTREETTRVSWSGPPAVSERSARLPVARFNEYASSTDAAWTRSALLTATEFAGAEDSEARSTSVRLESEGEARNNAIATVTLDGLLDDSVEAMRFVLSLQRQPDGSWRLTGGRWAQRCHPGRGHRTFLPRFCL